MKAKYSFFLLVFFFGLLACDNDSDSLDGSEEYKMVWCPSLTESTIADGSVTLQWSRFNDMLYSKNEIDTKCVIIDYVTPQKIEIYQSDNEMEGFSLIAEVTNTNADVSHTVRNLPNGKPVYFRLKAIRKGYTPNETGSCKFIPNPRPASKVIYSHNSLDYRFSSLSPDGKKMVGILYGQTGNSTYISNLDGSEKVTLSEYWYDSSWSSDGRKIFFTGIPVSHAAATATLSCYDLTSGKTATIKKGIDYSYAPIVSPDGNKVLYNHYNNGNLDLYLYDIVAGKDSLLMSRDMGRGEFFEYTEPVWIDDDNYLIKKSKVNNPYTCTFSRVSLKDNQVEDLLTDCHSFYHATLSPDGKHIVFLSGVHYSPRVELYCLDSKTSRQLTGYDSKSLIAYRQLLQWKDNQTIYYTEYLTDENVERVVELTIN